MKWSRTDLKSLPLNATAKFAVQLVVLDPEDIEVLQSAEIIYRDLQMHGLDVFFDDRITSRETKLEDARHLGLPLQINLSALGLSRDEVEVITRKNQHSQQVRIDQCVERVEEWARDLK